jgi:hypothetical protein
VTKRKTDQELKVQKIRGAKATSPEAALRKFSAPLAIQYPSERKHATPLMGYITFQAKAAHWHTVQIYT